MYRSHTCGELRIEHVGQNVELSGWVAKNRSLGSMSFVDLRDRYGITQLAFNEVYNQELLNKANELGREFVIRIKGTVAERSSKNSNIPTGEIEVIVTELQVLNASKTPPFTIETETDGGDELRMKYRYLDLRREVVRKNLELRHRLAQEIRRYLSDQNFLEVETPVLIKSTPEGARDFVVPSRLNPGEWYALPQSPQTFKQLLMVSGFDRYFQIVKCFRDEDLRADRQPEFTQIDCELSFIERNDILDIFEGMVRHLFIQEKGMHFEDFPRMTYADAMKYYGSDKPDVRFGMKFVELKSEERDVISGAGFGIFDSAESVIGICVPGAASLTRKQIDALTDYVKRPQVGASGMIWCRKEESGELKSSVDKFYDADKLAKWSEAFQAQNGDLLLLLAGPIDKTRKQLNELRLKVAADLGLRNPNVFAPLWVVDFPLLEWDEDSQRFHAMHHPFTSPLPEHRELMKTEPGRVNANAYDLVINGVEIGGGSIRIHDQQLQAEMFGLLGFSSEEAQAQFGFLMNAFEYGAPPHGGIALGFDRLCSLFGGSDSIRDFIAFPKNNSGRDTMIDAPSALTKEQLSDLDQK
ncbi:MAG: aspartate--tRNA ligase [Bacteroidia bacterium]|nr:aspartate--tRNA ligase [Bacteroidia bacterium]